MGEEEKLKKNKKKTKKLCDWIWGPRDTETPFSVFCLQRFYTLVHKDFRYPFYEASYILFIFTLSVNVKYANNRLHKLGSDVTREKFSDVNIAFFNKRKQKKKTCGKR